MAVHALGIVFKLYYAQMINQFIDSVFQYLSIQTVESLSLTFAVHTHRTITESESPTVCVTCPGYLTLLLPIQNLRRD